METVVTAVAISRRRDGAAAAAPLTGGRGCGGRTGSLSLQSPSSSRCWRPRRAADPDRGRVPTKTGKVLVSDLEIRVQRGQPLGTEGAVRDALDGNAGPTPSSRVRAAARRAAPATGAVPVARRAAGPTSARVSTTGVHEPWST